MSDEKPGISIRYAKAFCVEAVDAQFWMECRCGRVFRASGDPDTVSRERKAAFAHDCEYKDQGEA